MKLLGIRLCRGKLKAYLIQKLEEIQKNQSGAIVLTVSCFARIVTPFFPLASKLPSIFHRSNKSASPENSTETHNSGQGRRACQSR
jgi:hypothetical protein